MQIGFLAAVGPQVQRQRARVDAGEAGLAAARHEGVEVFRGPPVGRGIQLLDHKSVQEAPARFHVLLIAAVVADFGGRERHELARVGRIGNDLLVPGHACVEDRLAGAVVRIAEGAAVKDRAVCESQKRLAFPLLFPHFLEIVHVSMLFRDCFP